MVGRMGVGQMGFAEAFLGGKAGQNRRLERIERLIDWSAIEAILPPATAPGPGRPAYPSLAMFKGLLLAQWYQLSDPALEEALCDRISFRRFCGFALDDATPDETTFCRFRAALAGSGLGERLMSELDRQLGERGFLVKEGTMIDATLIEAQAARPPFVPPSPDESAGLDEKMQASIEPIESPRSASDPDARFARKAGRTVYGYKAHIAVDLGSGLIRRTMLTPANVNDTVPADDLVMGDERAVYADMAYSTHARRKALKARGIKDRIMHRPDKHHPQLPRWQQRRNGLIGKIRSAVERTFGTWKRSYGYRRVRYFSMAANAIELQLKAIAFNLRRAAALAAA
jgi:transposase, IS5 family